jgi:hypothetical protein
MAQEVAKNSGEKYSRQFQSRFALRRMLGQPVTMEALDEVADEMEKNKLKEGFLGSLQGVATDVGRGIANLTGRKSGESQNKEYKPLDPADWPTFTDSFQHQKIQSNIEPSVSNPVVQKRDSTRRPREQTKQISSTIQQNREKAAKNNDSSYGSI